MPSIGGGDIESQAQSDRFSTAFTDPNLDPVQYLNAAVPRLTLSAAASQPGSSSLNEVSSATQNLLSQVGAHNSQLSATLTQLTDEILRSGSRLAYEVEILRGDTIGLSDALTDTLQDEIALFEDKAPLKLDVELEEQTKLPTSGEGDEEDTRSSEPEYIAKLRMFNQVKSRLEEVIAAFGEAMEWPLAPSELSVASSFISVSAPDTGEDDQAREEKGREIAERLRAEVRSLLSGGLHDTTGLAAAARRVEHLRILALTWKGTAEEKARLRFVDTLAQMVEERRRATGITDGSTGAAVKQPSDRSGNTRPANNNESAASNKGGLFRNLQRLRDEIYLD